MTNLISVTEHKANKFKKKKKFAKIATDKQTVQEDSSVPPCACQATKPYTSAREKKKPTVSGASKNRTSRKGSMSVIKLPKNEQRQIEYIKGDLTNYVRNTQERLRNRRHCHIQKPFKIIAWSEEGINLKLAWFQFCYQFFPLMKAC